MSKHQSCRECRRDFVGPDSNIHENLCDECDDEIHGECHTEIAELESQLVVAETRAKEIEASIRRSLSRAGLNDDTVPLRAVVGDAVSIFERVMEKRWAAEARAAVMAEALRKLRDCDWTISAVDQMDAVRDIAREALIHAPDVIHSEVYPILPGARVVAMLRPDDWVGMNTGDQVRVIVVTTERKLYETS